MVNNRGWVRIIEATICALLIIATVLIYAQDNGSYFNIEDYADVESAIDEIITEKTTRDLIIDSGDGQNPIINLELAKRIKRSGIVINNTICEFENINSPICILSKPNEIKNVHVYERLISSKIETSYSVRNTKILKIVIFEDR